MLINHDANAISNLVFPRVISTHSTVSVALYLKKINLKNGD